MEEDIQDIKKLEAVLKEEQSRIELQEDFEIFLNYASEDDEHLEGYKSDSSLDLENLTESALQVAETKYLNVDSINFNKNLGLIKYYLTPEEIRVVNSCKDSKLKRLLLLNRAKNVNLKGVLHRLYVLTNNMRDYVKRLNEQSKVWEEKSCNKRDLLHRVGYPYFKKKQWFPCGPNEDAIRKKAMGEVCVDYFAKQRRWTVEDQVLLKRSVCFQYIQCQIKEINDKILELTDLKNNTKDDDEKKEYEQKISECNTNLRTMKDSNCSHIPPLNSNVEINWSIISKKDVSGKHSVQACKGMWNMFLHPSINKSKWTESEIAQLKELVEKYNHQDWEQIAKELGTNRTAFTVCVYFRNKVLDVYARGKFEPEEDEQLLRVVDMCRIGNYISWSKVAQQITNRDGKQLYNRYTAYLNVGSVKKGTFSEEEDILLTILVRKFGLNFGAISNYIPHRSRMQLSHRYYNYLNYDAVQNAGWTLVDDAKIMEYVETHGAKNWPLLKEHIPNRNAAHFRHRYLHIKKWLSENEGKTIEELPRKSERKPKQNMAIIKKIASMFDNTNKIPSLEDIKKITKAKGYGRGRKPGPQYVNKMVDTELIQYFQSTHKLRTAKQITNSGMVSICDSVKSMLAIMKAVLVVPTKEELNQISCLDNLDRQILTHLFQNVYSQYSQLTDSDSNAMSKEEIKIEFKLNSEIELLPPNVNTLVGMRGMFLKYNTFKSKLVQSTKSTSYIKAKTVIEDRLNVKLSECDETSRKGIMEDQEDFNKRLRRLFKWPAIMSFVKPEDSLVVYDPNRESKPAAPKKIGRPRKDLSKIKLMNERRMAKRKQASKEENQEVSKNEHAEKLIANCYTSKRKRKNNTKNIAQIEVEVPKEISDSDVDQVVNGECEHPRKKANVDESLQEELHEDISKLDQILQSEKNEENDF